MSDGPEIIFEKRGRAGLVTLNRPKALNALTLGMVRAMHQKLAEWARDPQVALVVVRGAGEKAFCAGGDIRQLHDWGRAGAPEARAFYSEEYRLNTYIKRYPKPYVALADGFVMGGGVGVSLHGSHRVAGSNMKFAMPETGIGLFPDVGGTYFLPRLPGATGTWLALTGARLGQGACRGFGLATHAVHSTDFDAVVEALAESGDPDAALAGFDIGLEPTGDRDPHPVYGESSVEEIIAALEAEAASASEWAQGQLDTLAQKSPTSLKIAFRQMQEGAKAEFEDCMRIEYRIVTRVLQGHDFFEGVRAVIIDKDNKPKWRPGSLEAVSDEAIDAYFAPLPEELDLSGLDKV